MTGLDTPPGFRYIHPMFSNDPCAAGCGRAAITGARLCAVHTVSPVNEAARVGAYISSQRSIRDLNAAGLHFESVDFSHRQFFECNFEYASFNMCLFTGSRMRMSFFAFCQFENCDFSRSDLQYLNFAGSGLLNCTFESSELVHLNYNGCGIRGCTFNNSNLYHSRFINADIFMSDFVDCNLKKTNFFRIKQESVSFKSSNTAEAIFFMENGTE
jgi:uncharacterized protein YjbI with pentapeptide repeats